MNSEIRPAGVEDAAVLARMRMAMWEEMNPAKQAEPGFTEGLTKYWQRMLVAKLATGYMAEDQQGVVGCAMLLLHQHPGRPGNDPLVRGYVTTVYVVPEARYRGVARSLMDTLIAWAREHGLQRLELRSARWRATCMNGSVSSRWSFWLCG